jgi:uncharacterized protein
MLAAGAQRLRPFRFCSCFTSRPTMTISWTDLFVGLALATVLEGLLPFLSPGRFRQSLLTAAQLSDGALRLLGLLCMLGGLLTLYWARA